LPQEGVEMMKEHTSSHLPLPKITPVIRVSAYGIRDGPVELNQGSSERRSPLSRLGFRASRYDVVNAESYWFMRPIVLPTLRYTLLA
jgi:hypothetical protein